MVDIKTLQRGLHSLGYDPGVVDGSWGSHTRGACYDAREDHPTLPEIGEPPTQAFCDGITALATAALVPPVVELPPQYLDLTKFASQGWTKGKRAWKDITGICLHQSGCPMSEQPSRWYGLKAGYGVTYSGHIYRVREETDFGWSAQSFSHDTISIEIAGFFCGIEEDLHTKPGDEGAGFQIQSVTPQQIEATKELIRYISRLLDHNGSKLLHLYCHRQSTDDRQPDPGSKVVQTIMIPMMQELGISDGGMGYVRGKGMKIPQAWNPNYSGIKY